MALVFVVRTGPQLAGDTNSTAQSVCAQFDAGLIEKVYARMWLMVHGYAPSIQMYRLA